MQHGPLIIVEDGIVGFLRTGQHHDGGGIVFRQFLHGQAVPGIVLAGVIQLPVAVFMGQQAIGANQIGGAQAVQHGYGMIGGEFLTAHGRMKLAHTEYGYRQLL